jgi:transglutaminase-like putative cysteine protease
MLLVVLFYPGRWYRFEPAPKYFSHFRLNEPVINSVYMAIIVAIRHNTYYKYDRLVNMGAHVIRLKPAPHSRSKIHSYSLNIEPKEHFINWQQDSFGNYLARVVMHDKVKEFKVEVEVVAEMTVINPFPDASIHCRE